VQARRASASPDYPVCEKLFSLTYAKRLHNVSPPGDAPLRSELWDCTGGIWQWRIARNFLGSRLWGLGLAVPTESRGNKTRLESGAKLPEDDDFIIIIMHRVLITMRQNAMIQINAMILIAE